MSEKSFLYSMMTDPRFRRLTSGKMEVDKDVRRGEYCLVFSDGTIIYIPRELKDDQEAMERYAVGAVNYLLEHGALCFCGHLSPAGPCGMDLADRYRRQWHEEVHGEPPPRFTPRWPKERALQKAGADVVMAARKHRDGGDGADLDEALAAYDRMEKTDPWEFVNKREVAEVAP